ncbi:MAG: 30S ribosomal protein S6 [Bacteroidota bacterium]
MRIRNYESIVLINAALEDEQIEATISRILELISNNSGELIEADKWGRKRLAYPINKSKSGYYLVIRFKASTQFISILERNYRLDENIIRYLTITLDKEALEAISKQKESSKQNEFVVEEVSVNNAGNEQ